MANRRMFSRDVCESDAFLDMPSSTQRLYFFLGLFADDEGFLKNPKSVIRQINASVDDLNILILKNFVIPFDSGVIVIKHWRVNNYLQSDRIKPTTCAQEKALLKLNSSREYEKIEAEKGLYTSCIQTGYNSYTQYSIDEYRVGVGEECAPAREAASPSASPAAEIDTSDLSAQIENHQHADDLIRRYHLPDSDVSRDAVLEDAERYGWEALEAALGTAALSNSRKGLSVNFYRSILNNTGRKEAARADPYAGFPKI